MCGIGGYINYGNVRERKLLSALDDWGNMMWELQARGTCACGLYTIPVDGGTPDLAKFSGSVKENYPDLMAAAEETAGEKPVVIGHTRRATGATPKRNVNNHPFHVGHITGVHNGVFQAHRRVARERKFKLEGECDSEVIFKILSKEKTEDGYVEALDGNLNSYNRVVFWDEKKNRLYAYTQDEHGLCIGTDSKRKLLWVASDPIYLPPEARGNHRWLDGRELYRMAER